MGEQRDEHSTLATYVPPATDERRPRRWPWAILAGVVVLALGGAAVAVSRSESDDLARLRRYDTTTTSIAPPEPIGLGSPTDGKASLRLPVRVTPDHDLVEGQQVVVTVAGFKPG